MRPHDYRQNVGYQVRGPVDAASIYTLVFEVVTMLTARTGIALGRIAGVYPRHATPRHEADMAHGSVLRRGGRWAAAAAAAVQAATAGGIALHAVTTEQKLDGGWSAVALLAILLTPAFMAIVGMTLHRAGLLSAGVSTLVLALLPVSLHTLTFLPAACVYAAVYARHRREGERVAWAAAAPGVLLPMVWVAMTASTNRRCISSTDVTGVLRQCSSNVVVASEAIGVAALCLTAGALTVAVALRRRGTTASP